MEESANPPQEDTDAAAHPVTVEQTAMASIGITISKLITLFPFTPHKQLVWVMFIFEDKSNKRRNITLLN